MILQEVYVVHDHVSDDTDSENETLEGAKQDALKYGLTDFEIRRITVKVVYDTRTAPVV